MRLILFSLFIISACFQSRACSIYKITQGGKTFVGYNVDNWDANTRIWFDKGTAKEYGAFFSGMDNLYPQAGMNEKGLMFGSLNFMQISTKSKKHLLKFDGRQVMRDIMKSCQTVGEVYTILNKYDRTPISDGILYFVDKSGDYLIVELDTMMKGNDPDYLISNYCPSKIQDLNSVNIPFFQKARKVMANKTDTSFSYLKSLSDTLHQTYQKNLGGTLYTVIYDLQQASFRLMFYQDFNQCISFNLSEELKSNDSLRSIPAMFPKNERGQDQLKRYNKAKALMKLMKETDLAEDSLKLTNYIKAEGVEPFFEFFEMDLIRIGYKLLNQNKSRAAIQVFKFNEKYNPRSGYSYSNLGNVYLKNKDYILAQRYYKKSLDYNPGNKNVVRNLKKVNEKLKRQKF